MAFDKERRKAKRAVATEYLHKVTAGVMCAHCGALPIEWHKPEHIDRPNDRISALRTQGASVERIQRELDVCTPLCRSCHMIEDGRLTALRANQPQQKGATYVGPKPCVVCGKLTKPTRRGRCYGCYNKLMGIRQPKGPE